MNSLVKEGGSGVPCFPQTGPSDPVVGMTGGHRSPAQPVAIFSFDLTSQNVQAVMYVKTYTRHQHDAKVSDSWHNQETSTAPKEAVLRQPALFKA